MIYLIIRLLASALCGVLIAAVVTFVGWSRDGSLAILLGVAVGYAVFLYFREN